MNTAARSTPLAFGRRRSRGPSELYRWLRGANGSGPRRVKRLALALGKSERHVQALSVGEYEPRASEIFVMWRLCGIPVELWDFQDSEREPSQG